MSYQKLWWFWNRTPTMGQIGRNSIPNSNLGKTITTRGKKLKEIRVDEEKSLQKMRKNDITAAVIVTNRQKATCDQEIQNVASL